MAEVELRLDAWYSLDNDILLDIFVHDYATGTEKQINDPELESVILARHKEEITREADERYRDYIHSFQHGRPLAALSI